MSERSSLMAILPGAKGISDSCASSTSERPEFDKINESNFAVHFPAMQLSVQMSENGHEFSSLISTGTDILKSCQMGKYRSMCSGNVPRSNDV